MVILLYKKIGQLGPENFKTPLPLCSVFNNENCTLSRDYFSVRKEKFTSKNTINILLKTT